VPVPLALVAVALVGTLSLTGTAAAGKTFAIDVRQELNHKPRSVVPLQSGSVARVYNIRWDSWGGKTASGRGSAVHNNCKPNCADGKLTRYPVTVKYKRKRSCLGKRAYVKFVYIFNRSRKRGQKPAKPDGFDREVATNFAYACSAPTP